MSYQQLRFLFLNVGHFLDHLFVLIFATAVLRLSTDWNMSYAELIPYSTPGFVAFGICAIPAGWLADKWSREGMMVVFFIGIGAASILAGMATTPFEIGATLLLVGIFAAIYHPVGLAMVVQGLQRTGVPLAINGIFGNMGVACAAALTGYLVDNSGWQAAFIIPGAVSIGVGVLYWIFVVSTRDHTLAAAAKKSAEPVALPRATLIRIFSIIFFTAAIGGFVFQSTTFALPKVFDERLADLAQSATMIGTYAFIAFSIAAFAQLVVGYLVDNYSVRYVFVGVALMQAVFFFAMTQVEGIMALVIAIAFMLAVFGQIPINDVLVGRMARSEWRSRAYSIRYIMTFSVYGSTIPLIAWIHSNWGFSTLFVALGVCASLIFLATLCLPGKETNAPAAAPA